MKNYTVVFAWGLEGTGELQSRVNQLLRDGYELVGGISVSTFTTTAGEEQSRFAQALAQPLSGIEL